MNVSVFISFILNPLLVLLFCAFLKVYYKKDISVFIQCFLFGLLSVLLVIASEYIAKKTGLNRLSSLKRLGFYSFFLIAFFSEFGKFIILSLISIKNKNVSILENKNVPILFYIACSLMITMGFLTTRNVYTYFTSENYSLFYALLKIPMNLIFAVIMGYFIGLGLSRKNVVIDYLLGLIFATLFHGLFILCILASDKELLLLSSIGAFVISTLLLINAIKNKLKSVNELN